MIGDQPNPLEVNLNKMTPAERAKWNDDNTYMEVTCITPKCGEKAVTIKSFVNRITNTATGRVEYLCGRCLHFGAMKQEKERAIAAEMAQIAEQDTAQNAEGEVE